MVPLQGADAKTARNGQRGMQMPAGSNTRCSMITGLRRSPRSNAPPRFCNDSSVRHNRDSMLALPASSSILSPTRRVIVACRPLHDRNILTVREARSSNTFPRGGPTSHASSLGASAPSRPTPNNPPEVLPPSISSSRRAWAPESRSRVLTHDARDDRDGYIDVYRSRGNDP